MQPLATLQDTFNKPSLDTSLWTESANVTTGLGRAVLTASAEGLAHMNTGSPGPDRQLRASEIYARLDLKSYPSAFSFQLYLHTPDFESTAITLSRDGGALQINFDAGIGGWDSSSVTLTYDPVQHAWWRIRASNTVLYLETSPDGIVWTIRRQKSHGKSTIPVKAQFRFVGMSTYAAVMHVSSVNTKGNSGAFIPFFM